MADLMTFPETWEEFEQDYGFTDVEQVYTNGSRLIQSFRVKQWLDHISAETKAETDTISRQALMKEFSDFVRASNSSDFAQTPTWNDAVSLVGSMPSAQPELKKGKWIPHRLTSREYIGTILVNVSYDYWFCDTCGYRVEDGQPMYNFCPNCGAKMSREESDNG